MAAPHLPQNFVPSARGAPQELQKAMVHLLGSLTGEYNAEHWNFRASSRLRLRGRFVIRGPGAGFARGTNDGVRTQSWLRTDGPGATDVVRQGQEQEDHEEKDSGCDYQLQKALAGVFEMHEEEGDQ